MLLEPLKYFQNALIGQTLTHIWQGYGSTLFLEFGNLREVAGLKGRDLRPQGAYSIMIEWSWRIENEDSILCGSWSDKELWPTFYEKLLHRTVEDLSIFGRLPELAINLSGQMSVLSFMTSEGQPEWTVFENRPDSGCDPVWITVEGGKIVRQGGVS